mmetsp:Transcript_7182/g.15631  ORF Transcript_7182/g.15631 Transcript_7182/m.15631 type:complete len:287 (-) Transcript_7182:2511-3371(-)
MNSQSSLLSTSTGISSWPRRVFVSASWPSGVSSSCSSSTTSRPRSSKRFVTSRAFDGGPSRASTQVARALNLPPSCCSPWKGSPTMNFTEADSTSRPAMKALLTMEPLSPCISMVSFLRSRLTSGRAMLGTWKASSMASSPRVATLSQWPSKPSGTATSIAPGMTDSTTSESLAICSSTRERCALRSPLLSCIRASLFPAASGTLGLSRCHTGTSPKCLATTVMSSMPGCRAVAPILLSSTAMLAPGTRNAMEPVALSAYPWPSTSPRPSRRRNLKSCQPMPASRQ